MKYCPHCGHDLANATPDDNSPPTHEFVKRTYDPAPFTNQIYEVLVYEEGFKNPRKHHGAVISFRRSNSRHDKLGFEYVRLRILANRRDLPRNYEVRLGKCLSQELAQLNSQVV